MRRGDWAALVFYLALSVLLLHRLALGEILHAGANIHEQVPFASVSPAEFAEHGNAIMGDAWRQHAAWQRYQREAAKAGRFPFWNPHEYLGMPFHGNGQTALFHPYSLPYYFLEPNVARGPIAILRLALSAWAMHFLLRRWGLATWPALAGGAVWMMAPFNIRWLEWPLSHSSLWLPIAALALDRYATTPTGRRWVVAALAAAVLQLAGHPETQFQAGVVAGLVVLARLFATPLPAKTALLRIAGCFGAMTAGTLLAAPQLLPFLVQVPASADWIEKFHASPGGLSPWGLWMLLGHDFFGRPRAGNAYVGPANYIEAGCGIGLVATGLALAGLFRVLRPGNDPTKRFALACGTGWLFFLAILFALPVVSDVTMKLPLFDQANRHRWILAIDFFGSALAAFGLQFALAEGRRALVAAGLVLAATVALGIAIEKVRIPSPELKDGVPVWWHHSPARYSKLKEALEQPHWRTIVHHPATTTAIALGIGALAGLALLGRQEAKGGKLVGGLLILEAFAGAWDFNATAPASIADPPAPPLLQRAISIAGADRMVATNEILYPNLSVRYGFRDVAGYDWPLPMRLTTALRKLDWRVVEGTSLPRRMAAPSIDPRLAAFLSRCAVRVIY
ncbi:MAG TPA: hypothetical protein VNC50_11060, partial [Planctomycetia bacterium]|nr:hypothetical protein [Planctomycetia bacterium]